MSWFDRESDEQRRRRRLTEMLIEQSARLEGARVAVRDALFDMALMIESAQRSQDRIDRLQAALDVCERALQVARAQVMRALVEKTRYDQLEARNNRERP
jgi:hypothetical protein